MVQQRPAGAGRSQIFELITRTTGLGTTVLLVEHNAVASLKIAQRAYILESSRIALTGPAAELISSLRVRDVYLGL